MKLSILQENLSNAVGVAKPAVAAKSHLPVLTHLLITAGKDQLTITGTDLNLAIRCTVDAVVAEEGAFTVPSKLFYDYIHDLPDERIDITLDSARQTLGVTCGRYTASVNYPRVNAGASHLSRT